MHRLQSQAACVVRAAVLCSGVCNKHHATHASETLRLLGVGWCPPPHKQHAMHDAGADMQHVAHASTTQRRYTEVGVAAPPHKQHAKIMTSSLFCIFKTQVYRGEVDGASGADPTSDLGSTSHHHAGSHCNMQVVSGVPPLQTLYEVCVRVGMQGVVHACVCMCMCMRMFVECIAQYATCKWWISRASLANTVQLAYGTVNTTAESGHSEGPTTRQVMQRLIRLVAALLTSMP